MPRRPLAEKPAVKDEAYWRKTFDDANKKMTDDAHELDILQREYNLKQQQYYSDPNTAMKEDYTRQDLNDTKAKIDDMTAKVAADKQSISDLEDELRKAGGEPGWETPLTPAAGGVAVRTVDIEDRAAVFCEFLAACDFCVSERALPAIRVNKFDGTPSPGRR